eukprot:3934624-Rhodomonas_salina.4
MPSAVKLHVYELGQERKPMPLNRTSTDPMALYAVGVTDSHEYRNVKLLFICIPFVQSRPFVLLQIIGDGAEAFQAKLYVTGAELETQNFAINAPLHLGVRQASIVELTTTATVFLVKSPGMHASVSHQLQ